MQSNSSSSSPLPTSLSSAIPQQRPGRLAETVHASPLVELSKATESLATVRQELQAELFLKISYAEHAAPLMPLQARDLQALIELFEQDEIEMIESDILENLLRRKTKLHWEDLMADL